MADLAYIRHLIYKGQWSAARAEAAGDAIAMEYVEASAALIEGEPIPAVVSGFLEMNYIGEFGNGCGYGYPHQGDGYGQSDHAGFGAGDDRGDGYDDGDGDGNGYR